MNKTITLNMPDVVKTADGKERRVGVEIELSGLGYQELVDLAGELLGGVAKPQSRYVSTLETPLGSFIIELDSDPIKDLDLADERLPQPIRELGGQAMEVIDAAAELIVPLEIVSPPMAFSDLHQIETLVDELREAGALGSRNAIYFAFGLQLNPELPDLKPTTLVRYYQAFAVLYDWLKARHQLDISRKFTPYIEPWSSKYTDLLIEDNYAPDQRQMMVDYLESNPTRNRALDLLPLFAHLDKPLLDEYVEDPRIKSRPTLHYRLPDCDIDNPDWHFSTVWNDWVVVEQLANHAEDLRELRALFMDSRKISIRNLTTSWLETSTHWLESKGYV
ncbi:MULTISPECIES: amidoligase family protein [Marinobacter]|uniref:Amidoligase family protein n=1 Tax=Marinobacter xiaoshiensis TaxID=3073652 RepID=A0ABU2HG10_9GAMM|nr:MULTISPECIES: amidoligase family protein [unclassified Marinobacter]MDS1309545.1 amidoligase family protein [Marinobacter sp. F60267]